MGAGWEGWLFTVRCFGGSAASNAVPPPPFRGCRSARHEGEEEPEGWEAGASRSAGRGGRGVPRSRRERGPAPQYRSPTPRPFVRPVHTHAGALRGWPLSEQAVRPRLAQRPGAPRRSAHGSGECHRGDEKKPSAARPLTTGRGARSPAPSGDAAAAVGPCASRTPGLPASAALDRRARAGWGRAGARGGFPAERGGGPRPGGERFSSLPPPPEGTPSFHKQAWNDLTSCLYHPEIPARA